MEDVRENHSSECRLIEYRTRRAVTPGGARSIPRRPSAACLCRPKSAC